MPYLRQSTAQTVILGPAIATGGHTAVTTLLASVVTAFRMWKGGLASTTTNLATGHALTHTADGHYRVALVAGDVNLTGRQRIYVRASGTVKSLAFWQDYDVLPTPVYDALVSGTTKLNVGTLASAAVVWTAAGRTLSSGLVMWSVAARTLTSGATVATSVWVAATRTLTSAGVAWTAGTRVLTSGAAVWLATPRTLTSGAAVASSVWVAAARTLTSAGVTWTAGTRTLTSGATVATSVWVAGARTLTSGLVVWSVAARTLTAFAFTVTAGAVAAAAKTGYALTTGQHDSIGTRVWAVGARTLTSAGAAWSAGTRTLTSGAAVGSSVWVTGLTELAAVPAAAPQAAQALMWVYMGARNKRLTLATSDKVHSSATVVVGTAVLTAATGSFTRAKFA